MPQVARLGNYQESEEDNWDDLVDNNHDLDDVLRTSIYSNRSSTTTTTTSSNNSPTKKPQAPQITGPNSNKLGGAMKSSNNRKPYQSISLADFENAMTNQSKNNGSSNNKSGSPLKTMLNNFSDNTLKDTNDDGFELDMNVTLNRNLINLMDNERNNNEDEDEDDGMMTLKRNFSRMPNDTNYQTNDDSDIEYGIEFPDDFSISPKSPKKNSNQQQYGDKFSMSVYNAQVRDGKSGFYKPHFMNNQVYGSTLDLSPANSSFSGSTSGKFENSSNSTASVYSESETDATDFYNDIEFENDDFEKLLELRLRKAKYQAELEEREFYLLQQKKLNKEKQMLINADKRIISSDVMNLPDDTFIYPKYPNQRYNNEDISNNDEDEGEFLEDFADFEEDLSFAIGRENDIHKNVVVKPMDNRRMDYGTVSRQQQLFLNDANVMKFYNQPTNPDYRSKSKSPTRKATYSETVNNRLMSKKSMPALRSASSRQPNIRKASSSMLLNVSSPMFMRDGKKKIIVQPIHKKHFGDGGELDDLEDLDVDFTKESQSLNACYSRGGTLKGGVPPQQIIDITKYMEVIPNNPRKSILKNSNNSPTKYHEDRRSKKKRPGKLGLIKHLNNSKKKYVVEGYNGNKMVYNPVTYKWEGNEDDAKRFASIKPVKQPALITFLNKRNTNQGGYGTVKPIKKKKPVAKKGNKITSQDDSDFEELSMDGLQIEGNMYFNPRKLCWITLNADEDSDEDPFKDINDLEVHQHPMLIDNESVDFTSNVNVNGSPFKRSTNRKASDMNQLNQMFDNKLGFSKWQQPQNNFKSSVHKPPRSAMESPNMPMANQFRGFSNASSPDLSGSSPLKAQQYSNNPEFQVRDEFDLNEEMVYKFRQEEERWNKKVKHWFQPGGDDVVDDRDYLFEIRNMVMGNNK
ncbi:hypothetical protein DASC09_015450 [Saccharomycopsis crataegensis]|uniref:Uncharacterized protein n=1 Tax=Saccharomycopsis crataegensis TaxID=43959 RepID=A0AAV5QIK6_9ASCO|nr:hypothetical protein DASC09_015450 [Saccharomycopsis crataegensis]